MMWTYLCRMLGGVSFALGMTFFKFVVDGAEGELLAPIFANVVWCSVVMMSGAILMCCPDSGKRGV